MSDARALLLAGFQLPLLSAHGLAHWKRVEEGAARLAVLSGGDVAVARWFGMFHDAARVSEGHDPEHGERAALLVERYREHLLLSPGQIALLKAACAGHEKGWVSDDPTVGACWDADRLELLRVGIRPRADLMSTQAGKREAEGGAA